MATSLAAAVRLQPWQQQHHHLHQDVMVEMACGFVKVRAFGAYLPRGRVSRAPTTMTTSSRRETLTTSAMSNEDHDITDMQETDKVSGEWWKPILTAVHEWSQDKLLGLAELADGSLFFSFGPSDSDSDDDASSRPASSKTIAPTAAASSTTEPTTAAAAATIPIPRRHASSFRKQSPIPASRKKAIELKKAAAAPPQLPPKEEDHNKNNKAPKKEHKARTTASKTPSKAAQPHRPPSSFFKRSPIPKERGSSSKKPSPPAIEAPSEETVVEPAKESPTSPELSTRLKESAKTPKVSGTTEAPGKKKVAASKASVRAAETSVVEVAQTSIEPPQAGKSLSAVEIEELSTTTTTVVEVVAAASEKENGAVKQDLSSYKLTELRSLAKARGLKGYSKLKKGELVELLAGLDS